MDITVDRFISDGQTTLSKVAVDGRYVCFGLEDRYRAIKVPRETRIPAGRYKVGLYKAGGFHTRYSTRFADIHRGMLHLQDVPGFSYILIHCGNTHRDTEGCLILGDQADARPESMRVIRSTDAYRRLYSMVVGSAAAGRLSIEVQDNDR